MRPLACDVLAGGTSGSPSLIVSSWKALTPDGLIDAMYSLKPQYQASPSLRWVFHRDAVKQIRKFKDGDGKYIWQPGIAENSADTVLGTQLIMSEYCPNT